MYDIAPYTTYIKWIWWIPLTYFVCPSWSFHKLLLLKKVSHNSGLVKPDFKAAHSCGQPYELDCCITAASAHWDFLPKFISLHYHTTLEGSECFYWFFMSLSESYCFFWHQGFFQRGDNSGDIMVFRFIFWISDLCCHLVFFWLFSKHSPIFLLLV